MMIWALQDLEQHLDWADGFYGYWDLLYII